MNFEQLLQQIRSARTASLNRTEEISQKAMDLSDEKKCQLIRELALLKVAACAELDAAVACKLDLENNGISEVNFLFG